MRRAPFTAACMLVFAGLSTVSAQQQDTIVTYKLGDIVIAAAADAPTATTYTLKRVDLAKIVRQNAAVFADLGRLIPAAHIQTNSRGETLVYLRNAGERQVGVFFDGALLNIPWDNRIDMSLIPASVIGGLSVAKGVPPVEYGANVVGGAVNLTTRWLSTPWSQTEFSSRVGTEGRIEGTATHMGRSGRFTYIGSVAHTKLDGLSVPSDASLPFSQTGTDTRTNTDSRITNVFVNGTYEFDRSQFGVSLIHLDAEKGVAPESHLDPAVSRVRFWRYPTWHNTMAIVSGEGRAGYGTVWKGAAWANAFAQDIESYEDASYQRVEERQEDSDFTLGTRLTLSQILGTGLAKFSVNGLTSTHKQRDLELDATGNPDPGQTFPLLEYQQHVVSVGAEYGFNPSAPLMITIGASFDAMFTPKTGDKPEHDAFTDYSATLGANYDPGDGWFVRGTVGRKSRFPTMRELFGESLDRFLLNPDLGEESSILTELALGFTGDRFAGEIIPFGTFTSGTIDQQTVLVPGETRPRRQRINLEGSRVLGVELIGTVAVGDDITVEGHLTVMDIHVRQNAPDDPDKLSEKPQALGRLAATYAGEQGTGFTVEGVYTGQAYSLADNDEFVPLDKSLALNVRVSQTVRVAPRRTVELFVRADNITDEVVLPQLGLPAAGRMFSGGVKVGL
jgi:iron complex outermembrane receptor protein